MAGAQEIFDFESKGAFDKEKTQKRDDHHIKDKSVAFKIRSDPDMPCFQIEFQQKRNIKHRQKIKQQAFTDQTKFPFGLFLGDQTRLIHNLYYAHSGFLWQIFKQEFCYNGGMIIVRQVKLDLLEGEEKLALKLRHKLHLDKDEKFSYKIEHRSLDLRKKAHYSYSLIVEIKNEQRFLHLKDVELYKPFKLELKPQQYPFRPIIIGYGPSGIFANYLLVKAGFKPIVFERGSRILNRVKAVEHFLKTGELNEESNVQFGEGGAGTFSDAKLTTRIKDPLISFITEVLIAYGAPCEIRYEHHPHIGTDKIRTVIQNLTDDMMQKGSSFHFDERVSDLLIKDHQIKGVITAKGTYQSPVVILACGHSSEDIYELLYKKGVYLENKALAVGFRVEHPQELIDRLQYKDNYAFLKEIPSEYFLRAKTSLNKGVFSFCMCPGGEIVNASFKKDRVLTNGMSYYKRDSQLANSAILVQIDTSDYGEALFAPLDYIKALEKKAYDITRSNKALAQNIKDYLKKEVHPLIFNSSYRLGTKLYDLNAFFDAPINKALHEALHHFDKLLPGFIDKGIIVGPETRSSAPLRIKRDQSRQSVNTKGLYPIGEGAGYGGGIMSCALDGLHTAFKIIEISS